MSSILSEVISGLKFDLLNPRSEDITPEDVAVGISREARYNGQTRADFNAYNVAEHSCHLYDYATMWNMPLEVRAACHGHDCTESVVGDQITPLKRRLFFVHPEGTEVTRFDVLEDRIAGAIIKRLYPKLTLTVEHFEECRKLDLRIIRDEWLFLRPNTPLPEKIRDLKPLYSKIHCWDEHRAKKEWLNRLWEINSQAEKRG